MRKVKFKYYKRFTEGLPISRKTKKRFLSSGKVSNKRFHKFIQYIGSAQYQHIANQLEQDYETNLGL